MKKILTIITIIILLTGCNTNKLEKEISDALKFKQEYEILNEEENYRILEIEENNPFIYTTAEEIIKMMDNKETFVAYFGFASCPWCRSVVPTLIEVANDLNIDSIYYVDVKEIRNILTIDEESNIITKKEGTNDYLKLLEKLDNVLESYIITDKNDKEVDTGEKRIYAPNIVAVVDGVAKEMTDGVSNEQTSSNMELTDKMKEESYNKIKCAIECVKDNEKVCSAKTKC